MRLMKRVYAATAPHILLDVQQETFHILDIFDNPVKLSRPFRQNFAIIILYVN